MGLSFLGEGTETTRNLAEKSLRLIEIPSGNTGPLMMTMTESSSKVDQRESLIVCAGPDFA